MTKQSEIVCVTRLLSACSSSSAKLSSSLSSVSEHSVAWDHTSTPGQTTWIASFFTTPPIIGSVVNDTPNVYQQALEAPSCVLLQTLRAVGSISECKMKILNNNIR